MEQGNSSTKHTILYEWKINEITSLIQSMSETENEMKLASPAFSTGAKFEDSWYLELKVNNSEEPSSSKQYLSVYLQPNNGDKQVRIKFSIFISDNKKEKHFVHHSRQVFDNLDGWGFDLVEVEKLFDRKEQFLFNDTLIVCIKLTVYDTSYEIPIKSSKRRLVDDFQKLLDSKTGSDIVFIVGDKKLHAHKSILIARSPVFALMLIHGVNDKMNELTITDINAEIMEEILKFIYTDKVTDLDGDAMHLLKVADRYQLETLKELCEESLCKTINVDNAVDIMVLADKNNAKMLLEYATNFVVKNARKVVKMGSFRIQDHLNCSVVSNLFRKITSTIIDDAQSQLPFMLKQMFMSCLFFVTLIYYIYVYMLSGFEYTYQSVKGFIKNQSQGKKNKLSPKSENVTLSGELTVFNDHTSFSANIPFKTSKCLNTDDFKQLFDNNNEISSDITLEVDGHEFQAHKVMLMVRNPLVSAMFMDKLKENKVDIADIDEKTIKKLLEFIFTDKVNTLNNDSELLLKDADKNQLQKLKSICDESLCNSITLKYAMKMMIIDDQSDQLREYATVFIVINITHTMKALTFNNEPEFPFILSEIGDKLAITDKANDEENEQPDNDSERNKALDFD